MEQIKISKTVIRFLSFVISLALALSLCGCSGDETSEYNVPSELSVLDSKTVAENDALKLMWNEEYQFGYAVNKKTGDIISPVPMDYIESGENNGNICSPISIEYYNITDTFVQTDVGYYCVEDNTFKSEEYENGVKATYYFSEAEVTVSLNYELRDDYLYMYVNSNDIYETGTTKLFGISIAPYFCSAKNTENRDSYLFVPAGSGAIMYTADDVKETAREYTADVYGTNLSRPALDNSGNEEAVRMPVYGAKNADSVNMGIISSGDSTASLHALAGDVNTGYSCVYPKFTVRDYVNIEWDTGTEKNGKEMYLDTVLINEKIPEKQIYGVNLYSLYKDNAGYIDIAQRYKEYLEKNKLINKSSKMTADYNLEFLGGVSLKAYTLGFPHQSLKVMTRFDEVKSILAELSSNGLNPNVVLSGFGESGLTPHKIGDSFTYSSKYGKIKDLKSYASENKINMQLNLNLLTYTESGEGFSYKFDAAAGANGESIYMYPLKVNVRVDNEEEKPFHLLGTESYDKASRKAIKFLTKENLGFYSDNLGSAVYSDCTSVSGMLGGSADAAEKSVMSIKNSGSRVVLKKANAYCAGFADAVVDTPVSNGNYQCFDEYVPFYEYVFGEYTGLYGPSLNICNNKTDILLKCIEGGVYPSFTVANSVDISLINSTEDYLYACAYAGNKAYINEVLENTRDYYSAIKNSYMVNHEILQDGITKTVFSNGVEVLVNHTENTYNSDFGDINAHSYLFKKGDNK